MRFTYTQAYQQLAVRQRDGEKDIKEKFHVIDILREYFGLHGLTWEVVPIDNESCRLPDLLIKGSPLIVIELDGYYHQWGEPIAKLDKDVNRDSDYESVGVKLVIINKELTQGYETEKVIKVLEENGLKRK